MRIAFSSVKAWCFRWTATHSLVDRPVVNHNENRKSQATRRVERERAVRRRAMKIDGGAEDRHLNQDDRDNDERRINEPSTPLPPKP